MKRSYRPVAEDIASRCLFMRVRQLDRIVSRIYSEALKDSGVPGPQLSLAVAIALLGDATPLQLAQELGMEKSSLSRNLAQLEQTGVIVSEWSAAGRRLSVSLSPQGQRALVDAAPHWKEAQDAMEQVLNSTLSHELDDALRRLKRSSL